MPARPARWDAPTCSHLFADAERLTDGDAVADDGTMVPTTDRVLTLFPERRLDVHERARTVQRSVAKLVAQHARTLVTGENVPGARSRADSEAVVERALRLVVLEYAAILRHLGTPPEAAITHVKHVVALVLSEVRLSSDETRTRVVQWTIEGYYAA